VLGLLSVEAFEMAWTGYQAFLVGKLNAIVASTARFPGHGSRC
jgi:superoxide dismutase